MKYVYNLLGYILQFSSLVSSIALSPHPDQVFQAIHQVHDDFTQNVKFVIEGKVVVYLDRYSSSIVLSVHFNTRSTVMKWCVCTPHNYSFSI